MKKCIFTVNMNDLCFFSREKLPTKYQRLFNEMQQLMDPSRNMSRYRNLLNGDEVQPPVIPFYPVVKKDLTFIHIANDSKMDGLVNFEKLRMIAKEVNRIWQFLQWKLFICLCVVPLNSEYVKKVKFQHEKKMCAMCISFLYSLPIGF